VMLFFRQGPFHASAKGRKESARWDNSWQQTNVCGADSPTLK
jgi:hypothetical protein